MLGCWDRHQKPFRWMGEGVAANIVCRYAFWRVTVLHFACFFFEVLLFGQLIAEERFEAYQHPFLTSWSCLMCFLGVARECWKVKGEPWRQTGKLFLYLGHQAQGGPSIRCTLRIRCAKRTTFVRWSASTIVAVPRQRCAFFAEGPTWSPFTFEVSHRVTIPVYDTCTIYLILNEMSAKAIAANIFLIFIFALISPPESSPFFNSVIAGFVAGTSWTIRTFYRNVEQKVPCPLPKTAGLWWVTVVYCENVRKSNDLVCLCSNILMIIQTITTRCFKCSGATIL